MKIVIAGGSGFLGHELIKHFNQDAVQIVILTRQPNYKDGSIQYIQWLTPNSTPEKYIEDADVIINLAGVSLNEGRWTNGKKEAIYASRMQATKELFRLVNRLTNKPKTLVNASTVGIYPISKAATYNEASTQKATDFLGTTVADWEDMANKFTAFNMRVVLARFGVILGKNGGALPMMAFPYQFGVGGNLGSGQQWVSWIHINDVVRAIDFVIANEKIKGIVNVTSPHPVRMAQFGQSIAAVLNKKHWLHAPSFLLKAVLGEKSVMVLDGQRVLPVVLEKEKFQFSYPKIQDALVNLL